MKCHAQISELALNKLAKVIFTRRRKSPFVFPQVNRPCFSEELAWAECQTGFAT